MISIGHRTGLFDTMATLPPSTSEQIAAAAGLNERYVREWLGAHDRQAASSTTTPTRRPIALPPEHAAWLTRAAGPTTSRVRAVRRPARARSRTQIVECFRNGGGVPYSAFPTFQQLMAEEQRPGHDATLVERTLPLVPGLVERLEAGIDVADIGCGQGHAINLMAQAFPNSRFTGYDFSEEGDRRRHGGGRASGPHERPLRGHATPRRSTTAEQFDFITAFDAIHDQARPRRVLKGIADALRPDGVFLMRRHRARRATSRTTWTIPLAPFLYTSRRCTA